jgi:hypothetical protein
MESIAIKKLEGLLKPFESVINNRSLSRSNPSAPRDQRATQHDRTQCDQRQHGREIAASAVRFESFQRDGGGCHVSLFLGILRKYGD